jgi:magnesium transporter
MKSSLPGMRAARKVMGRIVSPVRKPAGSPPGTLIHTGPRKVEDVKVHRLSFGPDRLEEKAGGELIPLLSGPEGTSVDWVNIDGLHRTDMLEELDPRYGIHRLVLEDVLSTNQRPKAEDHGRYFFVVLKMLTFDEETRSVTAEQVSLIVLDGLLMSFQERPGDVFDPVRERLRHAKGRIRSRGVDYLAYALIDAVVDSYFSVLERIGDEIEALEVAALTDHGPETTRAIHELRRETLVIRRAVWPLRDALGPMYRGDMAGVTEETAVFMRDVHDHAVQVIDTVESLRELLAAVMDLHLSNVSNRMNEVMKVLTVIATIFIPLSFFAGLYGMNFEHMPELSLPWAYPALLGFMTATALGMVGYFKHKGWF